MYTSTEIHSRRTRSKYVQRRFVPHYALLSILLFLILTYKCLTYPYMVEDLYYDASNGDGIYNIFNITVYAVIAILSLLVINERFNKWGIELDAKFIIALTPIIAFGALLRVYDDTGIITYPYNILIISPIVYFVITIITVSLIYVQVAYVRRVRPSLTYNDVLISVGLCLFVMALAGLFYYHTFDGKALGVFVVNVSILFMLLAFVHYVLRSMFNDNNDFKDWQYLAYLLVILAWCLDAMITVYGVNYLGYAEKNVISGMIVESFGVNVFMVEKLAFAIIYCLVLEFKVNKVGGKNYDYMFLTAFYVLGLAPAIRNLVRIVLGI